MTTETFYRRVLLEGGAAGLDEARRATGAVLHALRDRLTPEESEQAVAQLSRPLKLLWWHGEVQGRRPLKMHRRDFFARVQRDGELASEREARRATRAVFGALKEQLSPGEADDILAQLPRDLKVVWEDA
jgi:uncharacterized protein (DUF2267 family)